MALDGLEQNSEQEKSYLAFSFAKKFIEQSCQCIQQVCPHINISYFAKIAIKLLDYEIITETKDNRNYQTVFELLRREVVALTGAHDSWGSVTCSPLAVLSCKICIIYNVAFRFVAVFLDHLERDVKDEHVQRINLSIERLLQNQECQCLQVSQICPLGGIFQHYRSAKLTESEFCPFAQSAPTSPVAPQATGPSSGIMSTRQLSASAPKFVQTSEIPMQPREKRVPKTSPNPLQARDDRASSIPKTDSLSLQKRMDRPGMERDPTRPQTGMGNAGQYRYDFSSITPGKTAEQSAGSDIYDTPGKHQGDTASFPEADSGDESVLFDLPPGPIRPKPQTDPFGMSRIEKQPAEETDSVIFDEPPPPLGIQSDVAPTQARMSLSRTPSYAGTSRYTTRYAPDMFGDKVDAGLISLGSGQLKDGDRSAIATKDGKGISLTQAFRNQMYNPYIPKKIKVTWQTYLTGRTIVNRVLLPAGFNANLPPGSSIRIRQMLGKGGNGEVYLVDYGSLPDFKYVLKLPLPPLEANSPLFLEEINKLKRVRQIDNVHLPKIVASDFQCENYTVPFYLMHELQPVEKLLGAPKKAPLYPPSCAMFFYCLLRALKDLSFNHIIHCDIKPENILFFREIPVLLDFGASRTYDEINELELGKKTGLLHGTPTYLPPEILEIEQRLDGDHMIFCMDKLTQKVDVWALGLVFMKWLTGKGLFEGLPLGTNLLQILENIYKAFLKDRLKQYRHECERMLARLYLASDSLTQKRMRETDVRRLYTSAAISAANPMSDQFRGVDFKGSFVFDVLSIFDLCTKPYDERPKAGQLISEVEKLFPWIKEKYEEIVANLFIPPLDEKALGMDVNMPQNTRVLKKLNQFFPPRSGQ